jgi:hypothetical protein
VVLAAGPQRASSALRVLDMIAAAASLSAVALVVPVWGAVDGRLRRPGAFRVQALGMLGFGGLALAGLVVDPDLGRYLVAAGFSCTVFGTSSTSSSTGSRPAPMPSGAPSSTSS